MTVTPQVVPICCTNNPISSYPVSPSESRVRFSMISSLRIVPRRNCLWDSGHFCPHYSSLCVSGALCVCSVRPCPPALPHCGATALKRPRFFPCFTGTINVPWPSQPPFALIFPHSLPLPPLSEVSSLYWMVQKQNHKPISVTLAMRLDGPNLSPFGAIGSTPASLKRPLSSRQRGSFLFGDNCN